MVGALVITVLFGLLGLVGLLMAALAKDPAARDMGLGFIVLAWFLMLGYHGRRVEQEARRNAQH